MQASVTPSILTAVVVNAVSTITFPRRMGSILVSNLGPNNVFFTWDGVTPVASFGDGRWQLNAGVSIEIPYTDCLTILAICAAAQTCNLQVVGTPSAKNSAGSVPK